MAAPSAAAKDPWEFVVVRTRHADDARCGTAQRRNARLGLRRHRRLRRPAASSHDGQLSHLLQDCSAAIQNLLLAASTLELGAVGWASILREDRIAHVRNLLHIPSPIIPVSTIALGWPAETKPPRTRYREQAVHPETW